MGGGRGGGRGASGLAVEPAVVIPKLVNVVNLLIEHRQELALTDSQFKKIIVVKRSLDSTNAPLMRSLDSIQFLFKGGGIRFGSPSTARRDSLAEAHSAIAATQVAIRENISDAHEKVYGILSFAQATQAQDLESKEAKTIADDEKGKGRGGGGGGS
ncbi:MAG TPA: hypothetical protein VGM67_08755 [Gemmatimonadaceae bacterium]